MLFCRVTSLPQTTMLISQLWSPARKVIVSSVRETEEIDHPVNTHANENSRHGLEVGHALSCFHFLSITKLMSGSVKGVGTIYFWMYFFFLFVNVSLATSGGTTALTECFCAIRQQKKVMLLVLIWLFYYILLFFNYFVFLAVVYFRFKLLNCCTNRPR